MVTYSWLPSHHGHCEKDASCALRATDLILSFGFFRRAELEATFPGPLHWLAAELGIRIQLSVHSSFSFEFLYQFPESQGRCFWISLVNMWCQMYVIILFIWEDFRIFLFVCLLNPLPIFHTLCSLPHHCSLPCFSRVTTVCLFKQNRFCLCQDLREVEGAVECLFVFWFRIPALWGKTRLWEFGLKQPLPSSPGLTRSHRKGNCIHSHIVTVTAKSSYWMSPCLPTCLLKFSPWYFSFLWEGGRPIQITLYLYFCLCSYFMWSVYFNKNSLAWDCNDGCWERPLN